MHKGEGTVGNGVFYGGPCQGVIRRTTGARIDSWRELPFREDFSLEPKE
jgi:hypothetical protein